MIDRKWSKMLQDILDRTERGEIIGGAIQFMTLDGKIWVKTVDGDMEVPQDMLAEATANYSRLTKKGN